MVVSLKKSRQKLLDQERLAALGEVAAYSAHNIRNPLAGIRAAIQVMKSETRIENSELQESYQEIIETIDRLDAWLARLLDYVKPLELNTIRIDFNQLVKQSGTIAYGPYQNHNLDLKWNFDDDLPPVEIDSLLVEQALAAIATNSFQSVGKNGKVEFRTFLNNDEISPRVGVSISDNGGGVSEEIQARLFRIFVSGKEQGTGLGLVQAQKIVNAHRGEIKLISTPGKGTEVIVYFPITDLE
jgi:two-component system sensor histidine kinase AtoS